MQSRAQYIVLTQKLGIQKAFCVIGFSMGGQQVRLYDNHWSGYSPILILGVPLASYIP